MIPLYPQDEFENAKSREKLPLRCKHCGKTFYRTKHFLCAAIRKNHHIRSDFCSSSCSAKYHNKGNRVEFRCEQCGKPSSKMLSEFKKTKHHFCSKSCAAKYHNQRKQTGTRRSKFEVWLEKQLVSIYPDLEFHFNQTAAIQAELDIYTPSLKLAFEINGIFHYEPIFGQDKLDRTQTNDQRKFAACLENGIGLCIIDISGMSYFKPKKAQRFLDIITKIIDQTLSPDG